MPPNKKERGMEFTMPTNSLNNHGRGENWRFVKAKFKNALGEEHVYSEIGPDASLDSIKHYLECSMSDLSPEKPWTFVELVKDEEWYSSCVMWRDDINIDEMYKNW